MRVESPGSVPIMNSWTAAQSTVKSCPRSFHWRRSGRKSHERRATRTTTWRYGTDGSWRLGCHGQAWGETQGFWRNRQAAAWLLPPAEVSAVGGAWGCDYRHGIQCYRPEDPGTRDDQTL